MEKIISLTERVRDRAAVRVLETAKQREKLTVAVIEGQCQAVAAIDELLQQRTIQRNAEFRSALLAARLGVYQANLAACQLWFADELCETPIEPLEVA